MNSSGARCQAGRCQTSTRATLTPAGGQPIALCPKHWAPSVSRYQQLARLARKRNAEPGRVDYYTLEWVNAELDSWLMKDRS